ncbi:MAG: uracil-DNA glycosylase [Proteobacteria bacterium]|nr:uracil-DNA glycosylase [Pseudomonadota bacterium]
MQVDLGVQQSQLVMDNVNSLSARDMGASFLKVLAQPHLRQVIADIGTILRSEIKKGKVIFPPRHHLFGALGEFELPETKVVILGQDPYHKRGQAHGLAFSVPNGVQAPPSLKNILMELQTDIGLTVPANTSNLLPWAQKGVLLLNTTLTVEQGLAGSHAHIGWQKVTSGLIQAISDQGQRVVFMLWGRHAQSLRSLINEKQHLVLASAHPSPLSAHRGFLGSKPFSQANDYLLESSLSPVDWSLS